MTVRCGVEQNRGASGLGEPRHTYISEGSEFVEARQLLQ